uniref:Uncharacterized protein n=1 Tax=Knipowitschia caucasica TaxID=637954 RepID=A0AAV2L6S5_KNICA
MKVMPSRCPASCPTGCGRSSLSVLRSHTLHSASSLPENSSCDELSANATAFTSSSCASICREQVSVCENRDNKRVRQCGPFRAAESFSFSADVPVILKSW